ncbi:MAG: cation:proton antiporter [Candidatus Firestonebacteria bacterium]|nr:cation:proton antiporter [Candidatus Firestonebacteria bacterium]
MGIPLLNDIVIIFGLSIAVIYICHKLNIPAIVGFLLTGTLAGPHGFGFISRINDVEILAEVGVVLLLFTIGIEFSLKSLMKIKKSVFLGGTLQVIFTILVTSFIAWEIGKTIEESIFIGFLISLSSTAIVLKVFQQRAEVDTLHGQTSLAILIFQDIAIVPMILFTPLLAGTAGNIGETLLTLLIKVIAVIMFVFVSARWIVPYLLYQITQTKNREMFLLSLVVICFTIAWLTSTAGLSLALGAFLAGLIISESDYSHAALGNILPFRDVFTSFFFISIGMLLNVNLLFKNIFAVLIITVSVLILKTIISGLVSTILGFSFRTGAQVGFALSQVGEFSFVLAETGVKNGLINENLYQIFLSVFVLTMAATPFIIAFSPRISELLLYLPLPDKIILGIHPEDKKKHAELKNHLIIIGFGLNGKNLAQAAKLAGIQYVIIEMNSDLVKKEKEKGEKIFYGDSSHEAVLECAGIKNAKIIVIAISDPAATRRVTELARRLNPKIDIIARTRYIKEMKPLTELGADEVIPEEYETSIEIFTRVLSIYLIPRDKIENFVHEVRKDGYEMLRTLTGDTSSFSHLKLHIPDTEISMIHINEDSPIIGKSLAEIDLRKEYGVTLLAIYRGIEMLSNPDGTMKLSGDDILFIFGHADKILKIHGLFLIHKRGNVCEAETKT